jgi:hypothetical protein
MFCQETTNIDGLENNSVYSMALHQENKLKLSQSNGYYLQTGNMFWCSEKLAMGLGKKACLTTKY